MEVVATPEPPPPEPQAIPVEVRSPVALKVAQPEPCPVTQNVDAERRDVLAVVCALGYGVILFVAELYVHPTVTALAENGSKRIAAITSFFIINNTPIVGEQALPQILLPTL